ncbi:hypothetical protein [Streptomyces sp. ODS28]|uniref:hypothetical protein n=1 Tax=Streptomyces sp. ODS28 TaxID=3136688 RepID=UPI0031E7CAAC
METSTPQPKAGIRPAWLPPENQYGAVEAGTWWDVVVIDGDLGDQVAVCLVDATGSACGPIAATRDTRRWYFLVPAGTAENWQETGTEAVGRGHSFGLPGSLDGAMWPVRWVVPPRMCVRPPLVDAGALREALAAARPVRGVS